MTHQKIKQKTGGRNLKSQVNNNTLYQRNMKSLAITVLCFIVIQANSQSFHRGAVILELGSGLEYYNTQKTYTKLSSAGDTTTIGNAASGNFNAAIEIGIGKRIGIGARGKMNTFFQDLDGVMKDRSSIHTTDILVNLNLHPIRRKKLDVLLGAEFGYSSADVTFLNLEKLITSGKGGTAALYLEPRFYKRRVGFHLRFTLPMAKYAALNTVGADINNQKFQLSTWQGKGFGINAGVQLRIN